MEPVVEKDQHEPQCPWFLTGVTAPLVTQLTLSVSLESSKISTLGSGIGSVTLYPRRAFFSSLVQVDKVLTPTV